METSVSRRCPPRRTARMLEQNQSLLQFFYNVASLKVWYSTDRGSHTPPQDEGDCTPGTYTETRRDDREESKALEQTVVNVDREHRDGCVS